MNRIEEIRKKIDVILHQQPDIQKRRCGFVHLYGVAATSALLALKRGLNIELCTAAGMLHDIWTCRTGDDADHASSGAQEAEEILRESGGFSNNEISLICRAIQNHSNKSKIDDEFSKLLKDADVLQHHLYNPSLKTSPSHVGRLEKLLNEISAR